MPSKKLYYALGAVAASVGVGFLLYRSNKNTVQEIEKGVEGKGELPAQGPAVKSGGSKVKLRLTTYWPFAAKTAEEKKMEGGTKDRKGKLLHTLEQHKADPANHPYVALAGDDAIWPYGQRVKIPELGENLVFRIVDTGGHFRGPGKIVRLAGYEPIDVCVDNKSTKLPKTVEAIIVPGDSFEQGSQVKVAKLVPGASIVGGLSKFSDIVDPLDALGRRS